MTWYPAALNAAAHPVKASWPLPSRSTYAT